MRFVKQSRIAAPPGRVFAFHEGPEAIGCLMPSTEGVRVVEGGGSLLPGTRVVLEVRFGPFWLAWVAEHTEYEAGRLFADVQRRGPFTFWQHRHWFLDDGRGGTLLRDEVDFEPPFGWLGRGFARARLQRHFDRRHEATRGAVEPGPTERAGA